MKVTFSLPEQIDLKIKEFSKKTGLKFSTIVLQALEEYFERRK